MLLSIPAVVGAALVATAIGRSSAERVVELEPPAGLAIDSSAGPVELVAGDRATLTYRASWLGRGPELAMAPAAAPTSASAAPSVRLDPLVELGLDCPNRWPCRASSVVAVPAGVVVRVTADAGPVAVGAVDAAVRASTTGDHDVIVGPAAGTLVVVTEGGDVLGTGLAAADVDVRTVDGQVDLVFRERPDRVDVVAGPAPVTIELPPGRYAVSVEGSHTADIDVSRDEAAASRITVEGRGPIRILETTP